LALTPISTAPVKGNVNTVAVLYGVMTDKVEPFETILFCHKNLDVFRLDHNTVSLAGFASSKTYAVLPRISIMPFIYCST
jgi:hypothetical protein